MASLDDPIPSRLRAALDEGNGNGLECVVLFGSRARGDAHAEMRVQVLLQPQLGRKSIAPIEQGALAGDEGHRRGKVIAERPAGAL